MGILSIMRLFALPIALIACLVCLAGCTKTDAPSGSPPAEGAPRFTLLPAAETGVGFVNQLTEGPNTNILMYEYFYNGGGVAAAGLLGVAGRAPTTLSYVGANCSRRIHRR